MAHLEPDDPAQGKRTRALHETAAIVDFVCHARFEDLPADAVENARTFLLDALACGVAGRGYAGADVALDAARQWGAGAGARVIARPGVTLPPCAAAFVNGYQIHALEWDGLHEHSVVIALCAPMGAILAEADSRSGSDEPVSGEDMLLALAIAVEVAVIFGAGSASAPKFFRPAIAGQMGAAMALARLRGYGVAQTRQTLGLAYSMLAGTMQAHWEGSMALAMQVGQAARAAHQAADLARAGMEAPHDVIGGQFGYFTLFEERGDVAGVLAALARPWKITEMAHKPFPAGRATQAVLTMLYDLIGEHDFTGADVARLDVAAPSLILTLVGRPLTDDMTPAYARLCLKFIAPLMLIDGQIDPLVFTPERFADPAIHALAAKLHLVNDGNPDPNALGPQSCTVTLKDGRVLAAHCDHPLGAPGNPLPRDGQRDKAARCYAAGGFAGDPDDLFATVSRLADMPDSARLIDIVIDPKEPSP